LAAGACGGAEISPIARIDLTPALVCEGAAATAVIVSGTRSTDAEGETEGLRFAWSFSRTPEEILRGRLDEPELVVRMATVGPTGVSLRLWDEAGTEGQGSDVIAVGRAAARLCAQGCGNRELCVPVDGNETCVDDLTCADDGECGCYVCRPDDRGARRCLPPVTSP
jgi:hypothetical protein